MRSNKSSAGVFCPLLDSGPPKGEMWVAVKRAKIPFHIEEVGTGAEGKAKLRNLQAAQANKDWVSVQTRLQNATIAFQKGEGDLLDDLKANKIEAIYRPGNDLTVKDSGKKTLLERFKSACKAIWDNANLSD